MPITVVAVFHSRPGRGPAIIDAFSRVSPLVHEEAGCELYAAHLEQNGDVVIMVERWSTKADLDVHADGEPLRLLRESTADLVERPYDVWFLDAVELGDHAKGILR